MAYSLDQLRDLYPQSLGGLSDAEAINKISSLSGEDPQNLAAQYGVINPDQGDFARGLSSGVDGAQAGLYGLLGYAGEVIGSDTVRDYGYKGYEDNMAEVQLRSKRTDNIENAENAGDVIDSAQYWLGYALPQIVEAIVGSKGVGFVGKKTVERKVKKKVAERFGKDNVDRVMKTKAVQNALNKGEKVGSLAGIGTQAVGTELGYTYGGAVDKAIEDGKSADDVDLMRVTKYGLAAGATEFATDVLTLGLGKIGPAKDLMAKAGTTSSRIKNAATRGATGSALEAGTEVVQSGLEEMGSGLTFEEANFRDPTSAFAGAIGGGAMGTAGGAATKGPDSLAQIKRAAEKAEVKAAEQSKNNEVEKQQAAEEEKIETEGDDDEANALDNLRKRHAPTFQDQGAFTADAQTEQDVIEKIQVLDPTTDIGAAFQKFQTTEQEYLTSNEAANQALIAKFLKASSVPANLEQQKIAYLQALDDHAELQEARANGTREVDLDRDDTFIQLLKDRNAAIDTGDMKLLGQVEQDVINMSEEDPLFVTEWEEVKRNAIEEETFNLAAAEIEAKQAKEQIKIDKKEQAEQKKLAAVEQKRLAAEEKQKAAEVKKAEKVSKTTINKIDDIVLLDLPPQQRLLFEFFKKIAAEGTIDEYFTVAQTKDKDGNIVKTDKSKGWATEKIAAELGLKGKGNVPNNITRVAAKIKAKYGMGVEELITAMSAKDEASNQTTAVAENPTNKTAALKNPIDDSETVDPEDVVTPDALSITGMNIINTAGGGNAEQQNKYVKENIKGSVIGGLTPEQTEEKSLNLLKPKEKKETKTKIAEVKEAEIKLAKEQKETEGSTELDEQGQARRDEEHNKNLNDVAVALFSKEFVGPNNKKDTRGESQLAAIERVKKEIATSWEDKQVEGQPKFDDMSVKNRSEWVLATAMALETKNDSTLVEAKNEIIQNHTGEQTNESKRRNKAEVEKVSKTKSTTTKQTTNTGDNTNDPGNTSSEKVRKGAVIQAVKAKNNLNKGAVERLGTKWKTKYPKLAKLLKDNKFKDFTTMVTSIENDMATAAVDKAAASLNKKSKTVEPKSASTIATPSIYENMFIDLLGKKAYDRIKNRLNFFGNSEEAVKWGNSEGFAINANASAFVAKANDKNMDRSVIQAVDPDTIYFIVNAIQPGRELPVFVHEVGSHVGLDNILSPKESVALSEKIKTWASKYKQGAENSIEINAARIAVAKVNSLKASGNLQEPKNKKVDLTSENPGYESTREIKEIIAYFITEAVDLGATPSQKSQVGRILNKFRVAFLKFMQVRKGEPDNLTAQDIVDMAYGAANLQLRGGNAGASTKEFLAKQRASVTADDNVSFDINVALQSVQRIRRREERQIDNTFESTDYWGLRIDAFIAKRLPKNDKGHYISDNYIPKLEDWKKFQNKRAALEANLRKGLRATANERIKQAAIHEKKMYDPDGNFDVDLDYNMNAEEKAESEKEVATVRAWVLDHWGETAAKIWTDFTEVFSGGANSTKFLHQFINDVKDLMPAAKKWHDSILKLEKTRNEIKQQVDNIAVRAREMSEPALKRLNQFIEKSTVEQLWGYNPYEKSDPRYKKIKIDAEMQKLFNGLSKEQQDLAKDVFAHGEAMLKRKRDIAALFGQEDVYKEFFGVSGLTGPYAPLRRFGNYVAEFKSQAYLDAEALAKAIPNDINKKDLARLKSDPKEYEVSFFGTMGNASQYIDNNKAKFAYAEASQKTKINSEGNSPDYQVLSRVLAGLKASDFGKDTAEFKAIKEMIEGMYFDTLSEDNARRSQAKRKTISGYETNMMRSFLANATAEANLIANMEHGTEINTNLLEANKEKNKPGDKAKLSKVYNMMVSHYAANLNERATPIQDRVAALNTVYMLTSSIGYHLTNATQPIMVTIPKLVGDFGSKNYGKTMKLYWQGLMMARSVVTFNAKSLKFQTAIDIDQAPEKYRPLLRELQLRQLLDVGIEQDLAEFNRSDSGYDVVNKVTEKAGNFAHRLYQIARLVEAYNRISTATAAFEMAQSNPAVTKRLGIDAQEYAISIVQDTQGNFSAMDAPLVLKKLPKITGQYRKYQIMMAWVYADATKKAFKGTSVEEKAAGKRTVGYALGHAAMFSGMTGVPVIGMIAPLFMGIGNEGGDEPEDLERWIQRNLGDDTLGTILSRGLPAVFGIDMSTKLSQQKIFNPLPYSEFSADQESMRNIFFEAVSGPFGATASNAMRSVEYAKEGNAWRALEYALPKGVRTAMESYRLGTEGYSLRNGDVVATPDDFTGWGLALNALGIPATEINKIKWTRGQQYELNDWFEKEQSKIRKRYVTAKQDRNNKEAKKQMLAWKDLQKSKDRVRPFFNNERGSLRKTPLSSLLKAVRQQQKRQDKYRKQLGTD